MIVICEECGKKYRVDSAKIKGQAASFRCRTCSHVIVVSKPESKAAELTEAISARDETGTDQAPNRTELPAAT